MKPPRLTSNSDYGHVEIALADQRTIYLDGHSTPVWHAQLNIQSSSGGYLVGYIPTGLLHELADILDRFLERRPPATRVEVTVREPRKRKKGPRVVSRPPAAPTGDVDHEKEQIKKRMLEGR
jgi:hypothetical protein